MSVYIVIEWQRSLRPPQVGPRVVGEHRFVEIAVRRTAADVKVPSELNARREAAGLGERRADRPNTGGEVEGEQRVALSADCRAISFVFSADVEDVLDAAERVAIERHNARRVRNGTQPSALPGRRLLNRSRPSLRDHATTTVSAAQ